MINYLAIWKELMEERTWIRPTEHELLPPETSWLLRSLSVNSNDSYHLSATYVACLLSVYINNPSIHLLRLYPGLFRGCSCLSSGSTPSSSLYLWGSVPPPCGGNSFRLLVSGISFFRSWLKVHDHRNNVFYLSSVPPKSNVSGV